MDRIKRLERYQKIILLLLAVMALVFTAVYAVTIGREGFAYKGVILVPSQENGNTVYSGKINGEQACFTVYADKTVAFQYGEKAFGPYTVKEDPSAIPKELAVKFDEKEPLTGVELRRKGEIYFRGGVGRLGDSRVIFNEDKSVETLEMINFTEEIMGNDMMEPSVPVLLDLMAGPELTHKGDWSAWFGGMVTCILTAVSILYADELFRWNLSFQIRNAKQAEPSEWEMVSRYLSWIVLSAAALAVFAIGLQ